MGNQLSLTKHLTHNKQLQWSKQYKLLDKQTHNNIYILHNMQTNKTYKVKHLSVNKSQNFDILKQIQTRKNKPSPYVLKLEKIQSYTEKGYCSEIEQVFLMYKYIQGNLKEEILNRRFKGERFKQQQIQLALEAGVKGITYLNEIGNVPRNLATSQLLISKDRAIVINDPWLSSENNLNPQNKVQQDKNYNIRLNQRQQYPSPQKILYQNDLINDYNEWYSALFTLGIIILQMIYEQSMDTLYQKGQRKIYFHKVKEKIEQISQDQITPKSSILSNNQFQQIKQDLRRLLSHQPRIRQTVYIKYKKNKINYQPIEKESKKNNKQNITQSINYIQNSKKSNNANVQLPYVNSFNNLGYKMQLTKDQSKKNINVLFPQKYQKSPDLKIYSTKNTFLNELNNFKEQNMNKLRVVSRHNKIDNNNSNNSNYHIKSSSIDLGGMRNNKSYKYIYPTFRQISPQLKNQQKFNITSSPISKNQKNINILPNFGISNKNLKNENVTLNRQNNFIISPITNKINLQLQESKYVPPSILMKNDMLNINRTISSKSLTNNLKIIPQTNFIYKTNQQKNNSNLPYTFTNLGAMPYQSSYFLSNSRKNIFNNAETNKYISKSNLNDFNNQINSYKSSFNLINDNKNNNFTSNNTFIQNRSYSPISPIYKAIQNSNLNYESISKFPPGQSSNIDLTQSKAKSIIYNLDYTDQKSKENISINNKHQSTQLINNLKSNTTITRNSFIRNSHLYQKYLNSNDLHLIPGSNKKNTTNDYSIDNYQKRKSNVFDKIQSQNNALKNIPNKDTSLNNSQIALSDAQANVQKASYTQLNNGQKILNVPKNYTQSQPFMESLASNNIPFIEPTYKEVKSINYDESNNQESFVIGHYRGGNLIGSSNIKNSLSPENSFALPASSTQNNFQNYSNPNFNNRYFQKEQKNSFGIGMMGGSKISSRNQDQFKSFSVEDDFIKEIRKYGIQGTNNEINNSSGRPSEEINKIQRGSSYRGSLNSYYDNNFNVNDNYRSESSSIPIFGEGNIGNNDFLINKDKYSSNINLNPDIISSFTKRSSTPISKSMNTSSNPSSSHLQTPDRYPTNKVRHNSTIREVSQQSQSYIGNNQSISINHSHNREHSRHQMNNASQINGQGSAKRSSKDHNNIDFEKDKFNSQNRNYNQEDSEYNNVMSRKEDKENGKIQLIYDDGSKYLGDFDYKKNVINGFGVLYYPDGNIAYQGQWLDDDFHGKGKLINPYISITNSDQTSIQGSGSNGAFSGSIRTGGTFSGTYSGQSLLNQPFNYKNLFQIDTYLSKYEGEFNHDKKQGKGCLELQNGQIYNGQFKNDVPSGKGKYYCQNGQIINGVWQNGILNQETMRISNNYQ